MGASVGVAVDDKGHWGLVPSHVFGQGTSTGVTFGHSLAITNLSDISQLTGPFINAGATGGIAVGQIGEDVIIDPKAGPVGLQANGNIGLLVPGGRQPVPSPVLIEGHAVVSTTPTVVPISGWQVLAFSIATGLQQEVFTCWLASEAYRRFRSKK